MLGCISVLMPTHNSLRYLRLAVKTFLEYSLKETELIIHVDGSKDGTCEWLDKQKIPYSYDEWQSFSHGINICAKRASMEYVAIFNDDVAFSPNWDATLLAWLSTNKQMIVSPRLVEPRGGSFLPLANFGLIPEDFQEEKFITYAKSICEHKLAPLNIGMFVVEKTIFHNVGGYDENFKPFGCEDTDFYLRLFKKYPNFRSNIAYNSVIYHFGQGSTQNIKDDPHAGERLEQKWHIPYGEACQILQEHTEKGGKLPI